MGLLRLLADFPGVFASVFGSCHPLPSFIYGAAFAPALPIVIMRRSRGNIRLFGESEGERIVSRTEAAAMPLISINTGVAETCRYKDREARSGIFKRPVGAPVRLGPTGLAGDEQADTVNHGGPDKAVCVYSFRHYPHWERALGRPLAFGAFGENFTVDEWDEADVCIGDVFAAGTARVQVSQPRVPCWKLAMKWGLDELPALVTESGATGFYFRVLEPGEVTTGALALLERHPEGLTVQEANRIMHKDKRDAAGIRRLLGVDALAASWRETLERRLAKLEQGE